MPHKSATTKKVNQRTDSLPSPEGRLSQDDDTECDAILVTRSELGGEEEMKKDAKDALGQALQEEELHIGNVGGKVFVGSRRGLSFEERLRALEQQVGEIPSLKIKTGSLEDRVSSLTASLDAYKLLRNRFISTFKRDKLASATEADRRITAGGNEWAHGGDVVVDAHLYQGIGGRRDFQAFKALYGISPWDVQVISHQPTIDILNMHAKIAASMLKTGSSEFYKRFAKFIKLFEESDYDESYLEGNPTDVTQAYWSFMSCIKNEVASVDVSN